MILPVMFGDIPSGLRLNVIWIGGQTINDGGPTTDSLLPKSSPIARCAQVCYKNYPHARSYKWANSSEHWLILIEPFR